MKKHHVFLIAGLVAFGAISVRAGEDEVQAKLDQMTEEINRLQGEFEENESELETAARESIGETVDGVLKFFDVDIDIEEAIRVRDW